MNGIVVSVVRFFQMLSSEKQKLLFGRVLLLGLGASAALLLTAAPSWAQIVVTSTTCAPPSAGTEPAVDTAAIDEAICWLLFFQTGSYGAMLAAVSGISALVSAAMGGYKSAMNFLVVCLGTFMIEPLAALYFGVSCMPNCDAILGSAVPNIPAGG